MKKLTHILLLFGIGLTSLQAQGLREKVQAERVAFYTAELNLTPAEAEKFWPIYNQYLAKRNEINAQKRTTLLYFRTNAENLNESETTKLLNDLLTADQKLANLQKDYAQQLSGMLSPSKVLRLFIVEEEFKKHLINRLREEKIKQGLRQNR